MSEENWWPSKSEYDPKITKEQWVELLKKPDVFTENALITFVCIKNAKLATCADMAEEFGRNYNFYNSNVRSTGERVFKEIKCPIFLRASGEKIYWSVCCLGHEADNNHYEFKIRPELDEALNEIDLSAYGLYEKDKFLQLIKLYKDFYRTHEKEAFYDEEYKWKLLNETKNKSECEIALAVGKENITDRQRVNPVITSLVSDDSERFRETIKDLFDDKHKELHQRLLDYKENVKKLCSDKDFKVLPNDERTASALLACHNPEKYTFYMDTKVYEPLCEFLGIKKNQQTCEKYPHFLKIIYEFVKVINEDSELVQWFENRTQNYFCSKLLIAQNIVYVLNEKGFLRKKRFWVFNHTYTEASQENISDLISQAKDNNYAFMQYEYNKQRNQVVSPTYKNIRNIREGDIIFLRGEDYIYAYGKAIEPRKNFTIKLNLKKIIDSKSCEYNSSNSQEVIVFDDAPVFYFDFSAGEDEWGERIDVDNWISFTEPININKVQFKDDLPYPPVREITEASAKEILNIGAIEMSKAEELAKLLGHTDTYNIILHGAPGTGKTHLAKDIASFMHYQKKYEDLTDTEKEDLKEYMDFVQFHPSYDYTDFVEGLRPVNDGNSSQIGFERKDGVFKKFCERALKESKIDGSDNFSEIWDKLINELNENNFANVPLLSGKDTMRVELNEYGDGLANRTYKNDEYEKGNWIRGQSKFFTKEQCYNIYKGLPGIPSGGHDNYRKAIVKYMKDKMGLVEYKEGTVTADVKPFIFIIDEINRGEMSKIFGELFFSIDPGYRGKDGLIQTQYQNLVPEGDTFSEGFYVPKNVYIIGTMNDIDRNVESMDFAFRRRFTFKEIKATDTQQDILAGLDDSIREEAINRMDSLNNAISNIEGLSSAYHIGGAYFLKLNNFEGTTEEKFAQLWKYHLEGLLREYLRGMEDVETNIKKLEEAYNLRNVADSSKEAVDNS